jgi:hypothetical protein
VIKAPSLVRDYTWIWSKDPALDAPPDDAPEDARAEWARRLRVAQETGQWDGLIKAGQVPTKFTIRHIPGTQWRALIDGYQAGKFGGASMLALSVRCALKSVSHLTADNAETKIEFTNLDGLGPCAKQEIVDVLDGYDYSIVSELAGFIQERQSAPSPK